MIINSNANNTNPISDYDRNGAIIYTIVTLVFYSLSLFCVLILNIDQDDHYYEKKWSDYQNSETRKPTHPKQRDILSKIGTKNKRNIYCFFLFR